MDEYPFDTEQVPRGPASTQGIRWPMGTRYLFTSVNICHFHQSCGVERTGLVSMLSDKDQAEQHHGPRGLLVDAVPGALRRR